MENTSWLKQTADKPLFEDLIWSQPENKAQAGKLLIVGGNLHGFTAAAKAFSAAEKAGSGSVRVVLPDKLRATVSRLFAEAEFASSTSVGSFSKSALAQLIDQASWADGVLLAGDFGKNSETAIILEAFLEKFDGQVTMCGDSIDYFLHVSDKPLNRKKTVILADFGRLQALAKYSRRTSPLTHDMSLYELVKALAAWSGEVEASLITYHQGSVAVATDGKVSTTSVEPIRFPELAAYTGVWWLQNPSKPFEALTSAVYFASRNTA